MSTETTTTPTAEEKPQLSEKDTKLIVAAMLSLKAGVPDLNYTLFQKNANFNTLKTAQNAWGVLKKKIVALNPEAAEAAAKDATPKKRTKKESDGEEAGENGEAAAEEGSAKKKARTPRKKKVDSEVGAADGETANGSPKKKKTPAKKAAAKKSEVMIKEEDEYAASEPTTPAETTTPVKANPETPTAADENAKMEVAAATNAAE